MSEQQTKRERRASKIKSEDALKNSLIKITKSEVGTQKRFLIASIVSTDFIKLASKNEAVIKKILPNSISKTIFRFCSVFFNSYKKSVGMNINNIYSEDETINETIKEDVKDIIRDISKQYSYSDFNWEYEFDCCSKWLDELYVEWFNSEVESLKCLGKTKEAKEMLASYRDINWYGETNEFDPFSDELIEEALNASTENLFPMPASFEKFFGHTTFQRGTLSLIIGPAKSTKSFTLNLLHDFASTAGLNTMKFECGDLSQVDVTTRMIRGITRTPIDSKQCGERKIPCIDCIHNQNGSCNVATSHSLYVSDADGNPIKVEPEDVSNLYVPCDRCNRDPEFAKKIKREFIGTTWWKVEEFGKKDADGYRGVDKDDITIGIKKYKRSRRGRNMYFNYDAYDCRPEIFEEKIIDAINDGHPPAVVFIDYFGLLHCNGKHIKLSSYDKTTATIAELRNITKRHNVCIILLDQTSIDGAGDPIMTRSNFSDNKKKLDFVSNAYCISKLPEDAELGNVRLQNLLHRTEATRNEQLVILQDIASGQLNTGSYVQSIDDLIEYHPSFLKYKAERDKEEAKKNGKD